jgi:CheY-like chemotaxis protein
MNRDGEIIVIEDDKEDQELFGEILGSLKISNKVLFFGNGEEALTYLQQPNIEPFLILSDINLPRLNGFELRERVFTNKELIKKCIPYIFFTTSANKESVTNAYALSAQGFFIKPSRFSELETILTLIIEYWKKCYSPSDYNIPAPNNNIADINKNLPS